MRGAETVARRAGYRVLLCNSEGDLGLEKQYVEDMISHRAEGLLIAPVGDRSKANLVLLERRKFPLVLIDRSVAGFECDLVQADSVAGAKMLASHLVSVGHRRIAVIIEPDNVSTARERLRGFNAAMKAAGIKVPSSHVLRTTADRAGGYGAMQQIFSLEPRPSAVFAVNNTDTVTLGAMQAIRERGLVVPKDIALRVLRRPSSTWPCCLPSSPSSISLRRCSARWPPSSCSIASRATRPARLAASSCSPTCSCASRAAPGCGRSSPRSRWP